MNEGIDRERQDVMEEFSYLKSHLGFQMKSLDDYDQLKKVNDMRSRTLSKYVRKVKIYDLDEYPVDIKHWYELKNVKTYYEFFARHQEEFE